MGGQLSSPLKSIEVLDAIGILWDRAKFKEREYSLA